ncbi:hypothetical protein Tco_1004236 [Tanacetum coccineum]|uniref:Uncharacterized protein n=1 Tax=Tanacetum coccineum TaxID=301880 RepID=A0ABQ5FC09_9ASTR
MVVQHQEEIGEGLANPTDPYHTPTIIQPSTSQPQKKQKPREPKRKDTEIPQYSGLTDNVADEAVNEEMDESLERAATTTTSLNVKQDRGNIHKTQSKATLNEPSSLRTSSGNGPRCQENEDTTARDRSYENVSKHSNDQLLARGNTLRSGEDSRKLQELRELCITLQLRVLALETTKTTQAMEITSLKRRVKKLDRRNMSRTYRLKRLYKVGTSRRVESSDEEGLGEEDASKQGMIADINADAGITLDSTHFDADTDMFGVHDSDGDEVDVVTTAEETRSVDEEVTAVIIPVSAATTTTTTTAITNVEMTLAQALAELKSAKPKADKVVTQEPKLDEELAFKLQVEEEEERLAKEKYQQVEDANIAWDDVQAKIDVDYQLAQRLQAQEQEELTDEKKGKIIYGNSQMYLTFGKMLKNFDREDLEVLWSIFKARFKKTEPVNYMDNFLLLNLKTMFKHHVEDNVWKNQQGLVKVMNWKLYDSCGVHCVTMQNMLFYMLVEKMYPLINHTLHQMFNDVKLQVDYKCKMAFELPRLVKKQLKEGYVPE